MILNTLKYQDDTYFHCGQSHAYSDIESTGYQNPEWQIDKTVLHITK